MNDDASSWQRVLAAWRASDELHELGPSATEEEVALVETWLGRSLPADFRRLYAFGDGLRLFGGNLNLYPLRPRPGWHGFGLVTESLDPYAEELREWQWRIPDELVVIGDDGGDETFGVWLPAGQPRGSAPIVEIAEGGEPMLGREGEGLALAGTGLVEFLVSRTAYYSLLYQADPRALDALGVPDELRVDDPGDDVFAALHAWADPGLPDPNPDPYARPVPAARLRAEFGANAP